MSNNYQPVFTDSEVITCYLFGIQAFGLCEISKIHRYIAYHWKSWFPKLPSYQAFNRRLNQLTEVFPCLLDAILTELRSRFILWNTRLADSFPVRVAKAKRADNAKVARDLCNKGFCSSKDEWYYGVKIHVLALDQPGSLPVPSHIGLSEASVSDLTMIRHILPQLQGGEICWDKAYADQDLDLQMFEKQQVKCITPIKKAKGEIQHATEIWHNEAVSKLRQPIEALFSWFLKKTNIEDASKVRSSSGLLIHVFGKLTAAFYLWVLGVFNP